MVNYNNGKIYKIITDYSEKIYIGSTTKQYLCQRWQTHRYDYESYNRGNIKKYLSAFLLFEEFGFDNCKIILLENYPCKNKDELISREEYWRKQFNNCINQRRAKVTRDDLRLGGRNHYYKHKEKILQNHKLNRNKKFICDICCYETNKDNYQKHIKRNYHLKLVNLDNQIKETNNKYFLMKK